MSAIPEHDYTLENAILVITGADNEIDDMHDSCPKITFRNDEHDEGVKTLIATTDDGEEIGRYRMELTPIPLGGYH